MTNLEEPMDIDEGWKQIKAKAIDVLLEQLQQGFDEKARPFDVSYFLLGPLCPIPLLPPTTPILFHPWHCIVSPLPRQLTHFFSQPMPLLHATATEQRLHGSIHHLLQFMHSKGPS